MTDDERREMVYNKTPIDKILQIIDFGEYFVAIGLAGGDTLTYRFYNDGTICEK